jgi:hypothetical protein
MLPVSDAAGIPTPPASDALATEVVGAAHECRSGRSPFDHPRKRPLALLPRTFQMETTMRYLSMIRVNENSGMAPSAELMEEMGKLIDELTKSGALVQTSGLRPTAEGKRVRQRRGQQTTTDGPFTESKEVIGGFAIVEAASMDDAIALTKRFLAVHGDEWDIECEVRQMVGPDCDTPGERGARS